MQGMHLHHDRARGYGRLPLFGAALALAVFCALPSPSVRAAGPAGTLAMNPSTASLTVSDTLSMTFDISGGSAIHAVHIGVSYNTSVLQVVDYDAIAAGVQIAPGVFPGDNTVGSVLQNSVSSGIINYQYALNGSTEVSGAGTVATVQFTAIGNGNANLTWSATQLTDGSSSTINANGSTAIVVVGGIAPTLTPTTTSVATATPAATNTPAATATATATGSPLASATASPTRTTTGTATVTQTPTPAGTGTPAATATPRLTVIGNTNNPTPPVGLPPQSGPANGLPHAGNVGPGVKWWKWMFFAASLMLAAAGWFFTFAIHAGNKEVVLTDRFDRRRRRRY